MKFEITIFTNLPDEVVVKNTGKKLYKHPHFLELEPGQELFVKTNLAKTLFGDWTDETLGEFRRRKDRGIHNYEVKYQTKTAEISDLGKEHDISIDTKVAEPEFAGLNELEEYVEPPVIEPVQCAAVAKSKKQCKNKAEEGSIYCKSHQPKKGDK